MMASMMAHELEQITLSVLKKRGDVRTRSDLLLHSMIELDSHAREEIESLVARRRGGEPLQHILGVQQFFDREYQVGPGVFIPRPETECLVEICSEWVAKAPSASRGFEIGLGSGIISIELLVKHPKLSMIATEVSFSALQYAQRNAEAHLQGRLGSLTTVLVPKEEILESFASRGRADFLVSNPPYLSPLDEIEAQVRNYDPKEALYPPSLDPNWFYRRIALGARGVLNEGGAVFLEVDADRSDEIEEIFFESGWETRVSRDLAGRLRVLVAH